MGRQGLHGVEMGSGASPLLQTGAPLGASFLCAPGMQQAELQLLLVAAILTFLTCSVVTLLATVVALLPKWLPWVEWPRNTHLAAGQGGGASLPLNLGCSIIPAYVFVGSEGTCQNKTTRPHTHTHTEPLCTNWGSPGGIPLESGW